MKIFSGTANPEFAKSVANHLGKTLENVNINRFADGEINIIINENVRQEDCFIIQPTGPSSNGSPNDNYMELFILIDALKRGSANKVTVVMPYYGYGRQDRKDYSRAPISARVMASCLETMDVDRIITFDLHAGQIQGFFSCKTPFDNLYVESYFVDYINANISSLTNDIDDITIVSPDEGGAKRAIRIAGKIGCNSNIIYKNRRVANQIYQMMVFGNVIGKICIIVDDIIDTAGTACKAAEVLQKNGASRIYMLACHGIFSNGGIERINNSDFYKVIVTNTLSQERHQEKIKNLECDKIEYIDVSGMCAEAMRRSHNGESLRELYDQNIKYPINK